MESEGQEEEDLEKNEVGLLTGSNSKKSESQSRTKVIPDHRPSSQLWLHAALMCGRDFLYAVEVVLVTPIMLQLGMPENLYSYIWFCSPSLGLLLGPIMGNWSDRCYSKWGRRRPFILGFVVGTVIALTLMIFSRDLAMFLTESESDQQTLGIVFGVLGTQIMDFCLDQLETPLRAFTLDVCSPADQQKAFTLQTLFMGLGGALGFIIDGIKWEEIFTFKMFGLQIKVVYAFAIFVFLTTAGMTMFSIKEVQWQKPTHKKQRTCKSLNALNLNEEDKKSAQPKARKIVSESHIVTKRGNSMEQNSTQTDKTNKDPAVSTNPTASSGCEIPVVVVTSDFTKDGQADPSYLPEEEAASDTPKEKLPNYLSEDEANDVPALKTLSPRLTHRSPAVRSITLLPRVSLCKSVFMSMSCPEGLNDTVTSTTTLSLTTDDDSSSDEDDSTECAISNLDEDVFGCSMPNLPVAENGILRHPATFLEILKNKMSFSTSVANISSQGSDVDPKNHSYSGEKAKKNVQYPENLCSFETHNPQTNDFDKNSNSSYNHENDDILTKRDLNGNLGAVRRLNFDPEDGAKEALIVKKVNKKDKQKKRKKQADEDGETKPVSMRMLWLSILTMPMKLRYLCFSLLASFIGIEVLLLWYTNIFGRVVYGGDPSAPPNSTELQLYNDGVHMGCWGLTIYAGSMMLFSITLEHFDILTRVPLRIVYASGQLLTAISTAVMFFFPNKIVILSLSWTIGITVSTSLTIPYILVGKYHQDKEYVMKSPGATKRGYGMDCAILACQMYAGNLLYAVISGPVITSYGGVKIMLIVASICHTVAFVVCTVLVTYPGERNYKFCNRKPRTPEV